MAPNMDSFILFLGTVSTIILCAQTLESCYLTNGMCNYQIQVTSDCDPDSGHRNIQGRNLHNVNSRPQADSRSTPNGYANSTRGNPQTSIKAQNREGKVRSQNSVLFKKNPLKKENNLLNRVHKQFTALRKEISDLSHALDDAQSQLIQANSRLAQCERVHAETERLLRITRRNLKDEKATSELLTQELSDVLGQLNDTRTELAVANADVAKLRNDKQNLMAEVEEYSNHLESCTEEKDRVQGVLDQTLREYHTLIRKHANVTAELNITREELFTCYNGKTTLFCGFEDSEICGFQQDMEPDVTDWIRWRKATPTSRTGPSRDHTCKSGKGHYLYVEATQMMRGDNARLISPRYMGHGEQCVEFYYHMLGHQTGTLNVYTKIPNQDVVPMWRAFGNQGDVWTMARIPVSAYEARKGYQVVFDATIGSGSEGDIAIDDVRVFDGICFDTNNTNGTNIDSSSNSPGAIRHTNRRPNSQRVNN